MDPAAIKEAIARLRRADTGLRVFGAVDHRWRLAAPVPNSEVDDFEERHGVSLPEEYRTFLLEVGNGGAGPCYGLFPLGVFSEHESAGAPGELSKTFPHTQDWNMDADPAGGAEAYQAWQDHYFDDGWIAGAIPICHEGCGHYDLLVVTGPERGNIWIDGRSSDGGIAPAQTDQGGAGRLTFLAWYQAWLDEAMRECGLS